MRQIQSYSQSSLVRKDNSAEQHGIVLPPAALVLLAPRCQRDVALYSPALQAPGGFALPKKHFPWTPHVCRAQDLPRGGRGLLLLPCARELWVEESWRHQPAAALEGSAWDTAAHLGVLLQNLVQRDAQGSHLTEVDHPAPVLPDVVDQHHPAPAARWGHSRHSCPCSSCFRKARTKSTGATGAGASPTVTGPSSQVPRLSSDPGLASRAGECCCPAPESGSGQPGSPVLSLQRGWSSPCQPGQRTTGSVPPSGWDYLGFSF